MPNGTFKKKRVYFSQVSNTALRDPKLSLKAKGLYALIQSYITIEDFTLYKNTLKRNCTEGEKAFENTWKELKDSGYLLQEKHRNNGQFSYEYELLDAPHHTPQKEGVENAGVVKGGGGKGGCIYNTDLKNTDSNNTKQSIYIQQVDAFKKAYKDYYNEPHRDSVGLYHNICGYDPDEIYDLALEHFTKSTKQQSTIDYFETVIDRYR